MPKKKLPDTNPNNNNGSRILDLDVLKDLDIGTEKTKKTERIETEKQKIEKKLGIEQKTDIDIKSIKKLVVNNPNLSLDDKIEILHNILIFKDNFLSVEDKQIIFSLISKIQTQSITNRNNGEFLLPKSPEIKGIETEKQTKFEQLKQDLIQVKKAIEEIANSQNPEFTDVNAIFMFLSRFVYYNHELNQKQQKEIKKMYFENYFYLLKISLKKLLEKIKKSSIPQKEFLKWYLKIKSELKELQTKEKFNSPSIKKYKIEIKKLIEKVRQHLEKTTLFASNNQSLITEIENYYTKKANSDEQTQEAIIAFLESLSLNKQRPEISLKNIDNILDKLKDLLNKLGVQITKTDNSTGEIITLKIKSKKDKHLSKLVKKLADYYNDLLLLKKYYKKKFIQSPEDLQLYFTLRQYKKLNKKAIAVILSKQQKLSPSNKYLFRKMLNLNLKYIKEIKADSLIINQIDEILKSFLNKEKLKSTKTKSIDGQEKNETYKQKNIESILKQIDDLIYKGDFKSLEKLFNELNNYSELQAEQLAKLVIHLTSEANLKLIYQQAKRKHDYSLFENLFENLKELIFFKGQYIDKQAYDEDINNQQKPFSSRYLIDTIEERLKKFSQKIEFSRSSTEPEITVTAKPTTLEGKQEVRLKYIAEEMLNLFEQQKTSFIKKRLKQLSSIEIKIIIDYLQEIVTNQGNQAELEKNLIEFINKEQEEKPENVLKRLRQKISRRITKITAKISLLVSLYASSYGLFQNNLTDIPIPNKTKENTENINTQKSEQLITDKQRIRKPTNNQEKDKQIEQEIIQAQIDNKHRSIWSILKIFSQKHPDLDLFKRNNLVKTFKELLQDVIVVDTRTNTTHKIKYRFVHNHLTLQPIILYSGAKISLKKRNNKYYIEIKGKKGLDFNFSSTPVISYIPEKITDISKNSITKNKTSVKPKTESHLQNTISEHLLARQIWLSADNINLQDNYKKDLFIKIIIKKLIESSTLGYLPQSTDQKIIQVLKRVNKKDLQDLQTKLNFEIAWDLNKTDTFKFEKHLLNLINQILGIKDSNHINSLPNANVEELTQINEQFLPKQNETKQPENSKETEISLTELIDISEKFLLEKKLRLSTEPLELDNKRIRRIFLDILLEDFELHQNFNQIRNKLNRVGLNDLIHLRTDLQIIIQENTGFNLNAEKHILNLISETINEKKQTAKKIEIDRIKQQLKLLADKAKLIYGLKFNYDQNGYLQLKKGLLSNSNKKYQSLLKQGNPLIVRIEDLRRKLKILNQA